MSSNQYNCNHLYTTIFTLDEIIKKYGVAIIPNLLDSNECIKMINDM